MSLSADNAAFEQQDTEDRLQKQIQRFRRVIEGERSAAALWIERCLTEVRRSRGMAEGRGCYEWDDDRYRKEFSGALNRIEAALMKAEKDTMARVLTDCPTTQAEVERARKALLPELVQFFREEEVYWGHKGDYENWSPERSAMELIREMRKEIAALTQQFDERAAERPPEPHCPHQDDGYCHDCWDRSVEPLGEYPAGVAERPELQTDCAANWSGGERVAERRDPHPEDFCQRCGRPNIVWFAPNDLWNQAVPEGGILCPVCFVQAAEAHGMKPTAWCIVPEKRSERRSTEGGGQPDAELMRRAIREQIGMVAADGSMSGVAVMHLNAMFERLLECYEGETT